MERLICFYIYAWAALNMLTKNRKNKASWDFFSRKKSQEALFFLFFELFHIEGFTKQQGAHKNWLFFGERHRKQDFFYEEFWSECVKNGVLRLDLAFSRDQQDKVYVQHVMWECRQGLYKALEEGASLYVCGDAHHMAKDVDLVLHKIVESEGSKTPDAAKEYVKALRQTKRYLRDVY